MQEKDISWKQLLKSINNEATIIFKLFFKSESSIYEQVQGNLGKAKELSSSFYPQLTSRGKF